LDYERIFRNTQDEPALLRRDGKNVAVRFPDPLGRRDAAGRVIPHEFIVLGGSAGEFQSYEDALDTIWPLVADAFAEVWDAENPPSLADLDITTSDPPQK